MPRTRHSASPIATHIDRRMIRDFAVAFLVFLGLALTFALHGDAGFHAPHTTFTRAADEKYAAPQPQRFAGALSVTPTYDQPAAWPAFEPPPTLAVIILMAAMFAAFVTFNLAVARHLRCVSASPRRRSWREG